MSTPTQFSERFKYNRDVSLSHKVFPYSSDLESELDAPLGLFINPFESKINSLRRIVKAIRCTHCEAYLSTSFNQSLLNSSNEWMCELCFKPNAAEIEPESSKNFESSMTVSEYTLPSITPPPSSVPDSNFEPYLPLSAESYPIVHILVIKEGCDYDLYRLFSDAMKSAAPFIHQDLNLGILTYNKHQISLYNISQTPSKVSIPFIKSSSGLKEVSIPLVEVMSLSQFLVSHSIKAFLTTLDSLLDEELNVDEDEDQYQENKDNLDSFVLTSVLNAIKDWFQGKGSVELMETGTSVVSSNNNPDYFSNSNSIHSNILGDMTKTNTDSYDLSKIWTVLRTIMNNSIEEEEIINSSSNIDSNFSHNSSNVSSSFSSFSSVQLHIITDVVEPLFADLDEEKLDQSSLYKGCGPSGLSSLKQNFINLNLIPHLFIMHNNNKIPLIYSPSTFSPSLFPHSLSSFINTLGGNIWSNNIMDDFNKNVNYLIELFIQLFDFKKLFSRCSLMMRTSENISLNNAGIINNKILPYNSNNNANLKPVPVSWFAPGLSHEQHDSIWRVPRLTNNSSLGLELHTSNLNNSSSKSEKFIELSDNHISNYLLNLKDSVTKIFKDEKSNLNNLNNQSRENEQNIEEILINELNSYLPPKLSLSKLTQSHIDRISLYMGGSKILPLLYATFQVTITYEQVIDLVDKFESNYYDVDDYDDVDSDDDLDQIPNEDIINEQKRKRKAEKIKKNHDLLKKRRQFGLLKNSVEDYKDYLPFLNTNESSDIIDQKLSDFIELQLSEKNSTLYNVNTVDTRLPSSLSESPFNQSSKYNYFYHPSSKLYTLKKLRVITFRVPLSNNLSTILASSSSSTISQLIIRKSLQLSHGILGLPVIKSPTNTSSQSNSFSNEDNISLDFDLPQYENESNSSAFSFNNFSRIKLLSKFLISKSFQIPSLSRLYKSSTSTNLSSMSKGDILLLISQNGYQGEVVIIEALLNILMKRFDYLFDEYQKGLSLKKERKEENEEKIEEKKSFFSFSSTPTSNVKPITRTNSGLLDGVYYIDIEAPNMTNETKITPSEPIISENKRKEEEKKINEKKKEKDESIEEKLKIITKIFSLKSIKTIISFCFNYLVKLSHSYTSTSISYPLYTTPSFTAPSEFILNNYPSSTIYNIVSTFNSISSSSLAYFSRLVTPSFFFFHYKTGYISTNFVKFSGIKSTLNYLVKDSLLICDCGKEIIVYIPSDIVWSGKIIENEPLAYAGQDEDEIENIDEKSKEKDQIISDIKRNFNTEGNIPIKTFLKSSVNHINEELAHTEEASESSPTLNTTERINIIYNSDDMESEINLYQNSDNLERSQNKELDSLKQSLEDFKRSTSINNNNDLIQLLNFNYKIIQCSQDSFDVIPFKLSEFSSSNSNIFTQYSSENNIIHINSYTKDIESEHKKNLKNKSQPREDNGIGRISFYEENGEGINQDINFNDLSLTDFSEALAEIIIALMDD